PEPQAGESAGQSSAETPLSILRSPSSAEALLWRVDSTAATEDGRRMEVRAGVSAHPTFMNRLIQGAASGALSLVLGLAALMSGASNAAQPKSSEPSNSQPGLVQSEFIFETAPFASSHASTIVETGDGLL